MREQSSSTFLRKCLKEETPVPEGIHVAMKTLLYRYVAVGGLPAAVNALLETADMNAVNTVWHSILKEYRSDMVKYADDKDKPHIRACFNAIPKQLAKDNKKYQWSKVEEGGRGVFYKDSLQWLEDADIGRGGDLLTLPTYMQFLLDLTPEDVVLEPIDMGELTRLAREALAK